LPGLRRYARALDRAEAGLAERDRQLQELRGRIRREKRQRVSLKGKVQRSRARIEELRRKLEAFRLELRHERKFLKRARKYDFYWYNAFKKADLSSEPGFGDIAREVRSDERTYLHLDRLYTLWQAVGLLGPESGVVAEVGTYRGGSAKFLARALGWHDAVRPLYVCDTFEGHADVDPKLDGKHRVHEQFSDVDAAEVADYLSEFPFVHVLAGDIRETSASLADQTFGLLHLDVDVYSTTAFCLEFFAARTRPGSTVVLDDYGFKTCKGVREAVDAFVSARSEFRCWRLLTGQAVLTRME
jgi:predicted O-methyltransferase YrrM